MEQSLAGTCYFPSPKLLLHRYYDIPSSGACPGLLFSVVCGFFAGVNRSFCVEKLDGIEPPECDGFDWIELTRLDLF